MVAKSFLEDVKGKVRLSDILSSHVKLVRAGREFKACCPFHEETTPSFTVNDDKQFYHCFGCGAHGDHFSFLTDYKNMPFMDAVEFVAAKAGMQVPRANPKEVEGRRVSDRLRSLLKHCADYYAAQLHHPDQQDILDYLTGRALSHDTIHKFRLGFSPDKDSDLRQQLHAQGFLDSEMINAGMFKKSERGSDVYPFFRGRIMFPVGDSSGRIIAFGARLVPDHIRPYNGRADFTPPKYINTGETPLFHKGSNLYNISNARAAVGQGERLIVAEGYADVIALVQAGFSGAVAPLGTALTESQIQLLWSMIPTDYDGAGLKEPIICFDGDAAGRKAAQRALSRILPILEPQKTVRFAFMPEGMDPDDLIRQSGSDSVTQVLNQAIPLMDMIWNDVMQGYAQGGEKISPDQRAALEGRLMQVIRSIADERVQNHYREAVKSRLWSFFKQNNRHGKKRTTLSDTASITPLSNPVRSVKALRLRISLACLMHHPTLFDDYEELLGALACDNQPLDHCRQVFISLLSENPGLEYEGIKKELEARADSAELKRILGAEIRQIAPFAYADASLDQVKTGLDDLLRHASRHYAAGV